MPNSKQIVYLSQAQYAELIANGSITVDGVTVTYDENDIYVTPQAEPVTDVRVNGTSVAVNGVAEIPKATTSVFGAASILSEGGLVLNSEGRFYISPSNEAQIKTGTGTYKPLTAPRQHLATFYGLAKAAGDSTQSQSSNAVGSYTPEAKGAIQQMLGVSDLIAPTENTLVASKAYAIGDVFTANGKLYKVTSAIAANDTIVLQNSGETVSGVNAVESSLSDGFVKKTDYAGSGTGIGIVGINSDYGVTINNQQPGHYLYLTGSTDAQIKAGTHAYRSISPMQQHKSTFYGLAKAAGDTTQSVSDNAVGTYTDDAKSAIRTMLGAIGDIQVNGTSVVSNGVANIPTGTGNRAGVVQGYPGGGTQILADGRIMTYPAEEADIKAGTHTYRPISPRRQDQSVFYGLAKASGDTTQSVSSNAVGTYTDNAKASIKAMLGIQDGSTGTVDVSGATPTITAVENTRYVCGEVTSLSFTPPASGISIVRFTSGSTVTVLTLPSTVKFPEWFDPTSLETNTIYEICVTDGVYGAVMSWAL